MQDNPNVKVSICPTCKNFVRTALSEKLNSDTKGRNEFKKEVFEYNLIVEEMTVSEFKERKFDYCTCKS